jgi:Uma2 family endonuclease
MNLVLDDTIRIAAEFATLDEFRNWTKSGEYPDHGDYFYLSGDVWIDLSTETLLHNQIKGQMAAVLTLLVSGRLGVFFADRMRLVNVDADISCEPDGMFASHKSHRAGRVHWQQGPQSLEVIGTPDMVLEIVSSHSVQKDTVVLRELYAAAGIAEYWLVKPLGGQLSFDILRLTAKGYVPVRKTSGWAKSTVFGKSFRLTPQRIGTELPECRLLVR